MTDDFMDHRTVLASLTPDQRRHLTEQSDARGLVQFGLHGGAIVVVGALIAGGAPGWPILLVVQGVLIVFLFTALHETVHRTAFRTVRLNDAVARLCGFLILLPPDWFRYFHFAHHRHTQDPRNDPELANPKPETWTDYAIHISGVRVWWRQARTIVRNAVRGSTDAFVPQAGRKNVRREAVITIAIYVALLITSIALGSDLLLWVWIVPIVLGQPFLRLYLLAEHGRCPLVANMLANSRTTFTNAIVRGLAWNMPYHAEHHSFPTVPFHKLPDFHEIVRAHLQTTERGYARFHRNYTARFSDRGASTGAPTGR